MNRENVKKAFREFRKIDSIDYAYMNVDRLGDCMSCVNSELAYQFGYESKGIWLKHWNHGMNASNPIEEQECLYIAHDITEGQAKELVRIFSKDFHVEPEQYDATKCFVLTEK